MQTRKEWLLSEHGVGKGGGKGRISAEGHALIEKALKDGVVFSDLEAAKVSKPTVARGPSVSKVEKPVITERYDNKAVREWARANGHTVGDRGRIDSAIVQEYLNSTTEEERPEVKGEYDVYRDRAPARYPDGTTFKASFTYKDKDIVQVVNDRTCCYNCRVSLRGHLCDNPRIVTGYTAQPVSVEIIYPKGE